MDKESTVKTKIWSEFHVFIPEELECDSWYWDSTINVLLRYYSSQDVQLCLRCDYGQLEKYYVQEMST